MRFCRNCGKEFKEEVRFCPECGDQTNPIKNEKSVLSLGWVIIALAVPILGLLAGMFYAIKDRDGGKGLVGVSILSWFLWGIIWAIV